MSLMQRIREYPVPRDHVAIWWLGQSGYIFKSPEGTLAGVDLYLTNSCAALRDDIDLSRNFPTLIEPGDVDLDIFTCTHNHQDHTDPETIHGLRNKSTMQFAGPMPSCEIFRQQGVESGRIFRAYPDCETGLRDLRIHGTFALPTDDTDLNHMGYVFQFGNGPKVYITGDTDYHELLISARKHKPDLMITCINGGFNNMSHWEAAQLASKIQPKAAIPCHYDLFPDNRADPQQFRAALSIQTPSVRYCELAHGEPFLFSGNG